MKPAYKFAIYAVIAIVAITCGGLIYYTWSIAFGEIDRSNFGGDGSSFRRASDEKTFKESESDLKLHRNYHLFNDKNCGKAHALSHSVSRVVYGKPAWFLANPWIVALSYKKRDGSVEVKCAGTLISERIILTASHCLKTGRETLESVRLGDYDLSTESDCQSSEDLKVCADPIQEISKEDFTIVTHQNFSKYLKVYCDIGLIKLKVPAKLHQNNIGTICLPFEDDLKIPERLEVIGWGRTENASKSDVLLRANLPLVDDLKCFQRLQEENDKRQTGTLQLHDEQFCAGGESSRKDSCTGDSGGPLQQLSPMNKLTPQLTQYGIVSYGLQDCGSAPGVYTKISSYLKWILDNSDL